MNRSRLRLALVAALAVASSACSSDGSSAPSTTGAPSPASTDAVVTTTVPATTTTTTQPGVFADAAALAAELSAVEAGIRADGVTDEELADLGRRQQLAYRALNRHDEWQAELVALVDDPVAQGPLGFHIAARQASIAHSAGKPASDPPTVLPAWTIAAPLPADELLGYYKEAEAATGVPWQYLAAIHFQETRMGRVVGVSSAGAVGPMQFLPTTWAACCEGDPLVARDAIIGAATFLVAHGAPGDMQAALNAYNPNSAYVGAVTAYAQNMQADSRAYFGYHGWQVFYGTSAGTVRLPVGYAAAAEIDAAEYVRTHPDDLVPAS